MNEAETQRNHRQNTDTLASAVFFITMGIVLLLNTTGTLTWGVWGVLWRFWPIFLVMAGISILFRKARYLAVLNGIVALVLYTLAILVSISAVQPELLQRANMPAPRFIHSLADRFAAGGTLQDGSFVLAASEFPRATSLVMDAKLGDGQLTITDEVQNNPVELTARYRKNQIPTLSGDLENGKLQASFEQDAASFINFAPTQAPSYQLKVQENLPLELMTEIGAGKSSIAFDVATISRAIFKIGAGQLTANFSAASTPTDITVDVGAGQAALTVDPSVGVQVTYSVGAGRLDFFDQNASGLGKSGTFETPNFASATKKLLLKVNVGAGRFQITN